MRTIRTLLAVEPLGSAAFRPSPEQPTGWRGDWTGRYPGATPPLNWNRRVNGITFELFIQAERPAGESGRQFKEIARNRLDDPLDGVNKNITVATPWFSGHQIFWRSQEYLYCIVERKNPS